MLKGALDPVQVVLDRKVEFKGDLQQLLERARFKGLLYRALAKVQTEFLDEKA